MTNVIADTNNWPQTSKRSQRSTTTSIRPVTVMRGKQAIHFHAIKLWPIITSLLLLLAHSSQALHNQVGLEVPASGGRPDEYQLIGEAGHQIKLPCLIGKQLYCGEPYFIAWYKLNVSSKSWLRFEHKSMEDNELVDSSETSSVPLTGSSSIATKITAPSGQPLANRVRFDWSPRDSQSQSKAPTESANFKSSICSLSDPSIFLSSSSSSPAINNPRQQFLLDRANFDCAQLTISPLELLDEGQYKCEITFSESLDFDKCPATTLSQLNVIARPNEPELLVNGRKTSSSSSNWAFREGAQVKLECQSSGGKPAPRIEWLNVSETSEERVQLMRDFWPQKRTSFLSQDNGGPVTSSSLTVSLSRFDLHSQLVCLVLPQQLRGQQQQQQQQPAAHYSLEQLVKNPAHLAGMLKASPASGQQQSLGLMFKRIKLDVQVKPSSVSLIVRDVYSSSSLLEPVQFAGLESAGSPIVTPFYSLQLNRLYAIQCLVEQSRPQSQVSWFNRSAPIAIEPLELFDGGRSSPNDSPYYIVPNELAQLNSMMRPNYNNPPHRVSSFVRHELLPDGVTFRTTATLLLTTSLWDNFEELSCRISNEAFQLEELPQAAPMRLFVNYAPFAWLEPDLTRMKQQQQQQQTIDGQWPTAWLAKVNAMADSELVLRCSVAANPLGQNTILQIEWLKDGRKLQQQAQISSLNNKQQAASKSAQRVHIERANHLHMPLMSASPAAASGKSGNQLVSGSKLIGSSWLSISPLNKSDSGNYTCQFKLIPAPPSGQTAPAPTTTHPNQARASDIRITSGQANQTVTVNVIEAKPSAPSIRISSARGVFVYWPAASGREQQDDDDDSSDAGQRQIQQTAVMDSLDGQLSLSCDMPNHRTNSAQVSPLAQAGHKVLWYANNQPIQSGQPRDTLNTTLRLLLAGGGGGDGQSAQLIITCAHQMLSMQRQQHQGSDGFHGASSMRIFESTNSIDIRLRVGPRMLDRRELLMPQMRSFSELELSANPTNKLRLVCLAQCEPLCSIEWYLNQERLQAAAASTTSAQPIMMANNEVTAPIVSSGNTTSNRTTTVNLATMDGFVHRQELLAASLPWLKLVSIENVLHHRQPAATMPQSHHHHQIVKANGSSKFSWLRQSSLGASGSIMSTSQSQELDWLGRQLVRDASDQQYLSDQVNVFSRLELSYNSIGRLLETTRSSQQHSVDADSIVTSIKCRINPIFDRTAGIFEHVYLPPNQWFQSVDIHPTDDWKRRNQPIGVTGRASTTNLSSLFAPAISSSDDLIFLSGGGGDRKRLSFVDEMQISILLDRAPAGVSIWFAGISSTDLELNGVTLSESQLIELADPNRMAPLLQCKVVGHSQPAVKFKWTFIDWNSTELALDGGGGNGEPIYTVQQLNLRQLIELRQSQLNAEPMSALGLDVVLSSIVGNYTCTATNIHGSRSATMPIRVQGRPMCKLALANQFLGPQNELIANLRCTVYSVPPLIETIWFRNEQQLSPNRANNTRTRLVDESSSSGGGRDSIVSVFNLPVMVLNKQQEFLVADLLLPSGGNFKCVAKNSLGFSEACELNQASKQMLLNTVRPIGNGAISLGAGKNPALSMMLFPSDSQSAGGADKQSGINLLAAPNRTNYNNNIDMETTDNQSKQTGSLFRLNHLIRIDWLIIICGSLAGLWLLFILSSAFARRKFKLSSNGSPRNRTSWRFNSSSRSTTISNNEIVGVPFQGSKVCVNYYGGSNGDSEHEMIQSGSQSSHYEDFVQHQLHLKQQQQQQQQRLTSQPVYLNGLSTLNRPMKLSLSSSSTCDSSGTKSRLGVKKMLSQTVVRSDHLARSSSLSQQQQQQQNHTMRDSSVGSNVPLVNGSNNSRVNLDCQQQTLQTTRQYHHPRQALRNGLEQQLYGTRNEHIYDDVIYNQMIL